MDKDLHDGTLKLVRYKILFLKREYEYAFPEQEELVSDHIVAASYTAWKVAEFIQKLEGGEIAVPDKWSMKGYPCSEYILDGKLTGLPQEDKKYLRVYYEVLVRYQHEKPNYEEQQLRMIGGIQNGLDKI
jgi:hypothetical protein